MALPAAAASPGGRVRRRPFAPPHRRLILLFLPLLFVACPVPSAKLGAARVPAEDRPRTHHRRCGTDSYAAAPAPSPEATLHPAAKLNKRRASMKPAREKPALESKQERKCPRSSSVTATSESWGDQRPIFASVGALVGMSWLCVLSIALSYLTAIWFTKKNVCVGHDHVSESFTKELTTSQVGQTGATMLSEGFRTRSFPHCEPIGEAQVGPPRPLGEGCHERRRSGRGYIDALRRLFLIAPRLSLLLPIILRFPSLPVANAQDESDDYYCGTSWSTAVELCTLNCPTGTDEECVSALGAGSSCFYFTGCAERVAAGEFGDPPTESPENEPTPTPGNAQTLEPTMEPTVYVHTKFCGMSWMEANLQCDSGLTPCPTESECLPREGCHADIDCTRPIVDLESELIISLDGVSSTMEGSDEIIFVDKLSELLASHLASLNVELKEVDSAGQQMGASFDYIDITVLISARARPSEGESYNLPKICEEYINRSRMTILSRLKTFAVMEGSMYFATLTRISVGLGRTKPPTLAPTDYPTGKPTTGSPTGKPTPEPTGRPTSSPTSVPSGMPSEAPSRSHLQSIITHTSREIQQLTTTSFGYLFNVRTTLDGPAIILTGLDFYSDQSGPVNYELWSREDTFDGSRGMYEGWDLLASGTVDSVPGEYTSVPDDAFVPVNMPGGGGPDGTRAFYITLNTKDMIYAEDGQGSATDMSVQSSTAELEIYEGEAVLSYPFPDPSQAYFYRGPYKFVGAIHYDRLPCKPFSRYGPILELPCPVGDWPTASPTTKRPTPAPTIPPPTASPLGDAPTRSPVKEIVIFQTPQPTSGPTAAATDDPTSSPSRIGPTSSPAPTSSPRPTEFPTPPPTIPLRTNIVLVLRNINDREDMMYRNEVLAFIELFKGFMNLHAGARMFIEDVGLWHQQLIMVDDDDVKNFTSVAVAAAASNTSTVSRGIIQQAQKWNVGKGKSSAIQIPALRLTIILQVSYTTLPPELLGNMAVFTVQENEPELLGRLKGLSGIFSYFAGVTGVDVFAIEELERPDTSSVDSGEVGMGTSDSSGDSGSIGSIIAAVFGVLWLCLAAIATSYLRMGRSRIAGKKATELLMKQNQDPIKNDPTLSDDEPTSSRTIPIGGDWSNVSIEGDLSSDGYRNTERQGVSKSFTNEPTQIRAGKMDTYRLTNSDVVTDLERRAFQNSGLRRSLSRSQGSAKGSLGKSLIDMEWDAIMEESEDKIFPARSGRSGLTRSQGSTKGSLGKSLADMDWDAVMDETEGQAMENLHRRSRSSSQLDNDAPRPNRRNNFSKSMVVGAQDKLRKSLVDMECEKAMLDEDRASSRLQKSLVDMEVEIIAEGSPKSDRQDLRASLRGQATQRDLRRGNELSRSGSRPANSDDKLKSSLTKKRNQRALSQSMKVSGTDYSDLLKDDSVNLRKSLSRQESSSDLRGSGTKKLSRQGSSSDLRRSGTKKHPQFDQPGNLRKSLSRQGSSNDLRGSGTKKPQSDQRGNSRKSLPRESGPKKVSRQRTSSDLRGSGAKKPSRRLSQSMVVTDTDFGGIAKRPNSKHDSRIERGQKAFRKSRTNDSNDDLEMLIREARKQTEPSQSNTRRKTIGERSQPLPQSTSKPRRASDEMASSRRRGEEMPGLETDARKQTGNLSRSTRKTGLDSSATNRDDGHRRSTRKSGLDGSATNRGDGLRRSTRISGLDGSATNRGDGLRRSTRKSGLDSSATNRGDGLRRSTRKGGMGGSATNRDDGLRRSARKGGLDGSATSRDDGLRRSTRKGHSAHGLSKSMKAPSNRTSGSPQKRSKRGSDGALAGSSGLRGDIPTISELKASMIL